MAAPLTPVSKLEAVNSLLYSIGERPVTTLDAAAREDVIRAESSIDEASRHLQQQGWDFNTDFEVSLSPTEDAPVGRYLLPANVLTATVSRTARTSVTVWYVQRNNLIYDRKNHTDSGFTADLKFDYIRHLGWDYLQPSARDFVYLRAGVALQARSVGAQLQLRFSAAWADTAWETFINEEADRSRDNILDADYADSFYMGPH